jgi:hypothetical protein
MQGVFRIEEVYWLDLWANNKYCQSYGESAVETLQLHHTLYEEWMVSTSWVLEWYYTFVNGHEYVQNDLSCRWSSALCNEGSLRCAGVCVLWLPSGCTESCKESWNFNSVALCMKAITLKFEKNWDNAICMLASQVPITSQNRNILGSAHSEVQVAAPCSNSFQSIAFYAWNLNFLRMG